MVIELSNYYVSNNVTLSYRITVPKLHVTNKNKFQFHASGGRGLKLSVKESLIMESTPSSAVGITSAKICPAVYFR